MNSDDRPVRERIKKHEEYDLENKLKPKTEKLHYKKTNKHCNK